MNEYNTQKYQFNQDGKDYIVSTGIIGDRIRITCQESLSLDGPFYSNEFTLHDLRAANQFFRLTQTPQDALKEINKGIERQKSGLKVGINDTMHFLGYLVIGTDNDVYNLILRRDYEPNKYGIFTPPPSGAADIVVPTNYHVDGTRLNLAEANSLNLQKEESLIEKELGASIPQINKLKKIAMDIGEENALIKERLRILQKQLEEKKAKVIRLKEENENLKRENKNLDEFITNEEKALREKQALQRNAKIQQRQNINPGISAVTSKFEQQALRTFLPRTGAKLTTEEYNPNMNYVLPTPTINYYPVEQINLPYTTNTSIPITQVSYQPKTQVKILPTFYQAQPVIIQQQPIVNYTTIPKLRESNISNISRNSYKNTTYRASLNSGPNSVYKNKLDFTKDNKAPDLSYSSNQFNKTKDIPYSGGLDNIRKNNQNQIPDSGYSSIMAKGNSTSNNQDYKRPVGSRFPKSNQSYSSNNILGSKSPQIGYSSYMPNKK